jgi:hypothetical protein
MTLCPPGACPPERTTPTLSGFPSTASLPGTSAADGCPNRLGKSFAISSARRDQIRSKPKVIRQNRNEPDGSDDRGARRDQGGRGAVQVVDRYITWVSSSRAGRPVDEGELGAEDGGELERVMEATRLHLAVNGRQPPR